MRDNLNCRLICETCSEVSAVSSAARFEPTGLLDGCAGGAATTTSGWNFGLCNLAAISVAEGRSPEGWHAKSVRSAASPSRRSSDAGDAGGEPETDRAGVSVDVCAGEEGPSDASGWSHACGVGSPAPSSESMLGPAAKAPAAGAAACVGAYNTAAATESAA
jgi:hypothetical protein